MNEYLPYHAGHVILGEGVLFLLPQPNPPIPFFSPGERLCILRGGRVLARTRACILIYTDVCMQIDC